MDRDSKLDRMLGEIGTCKIADGHWVVVPD